MLELTIKTLDSQNHSFTLSDEATVLNLKESILEKMEVPIFNQRLIFHGKVLQDQKKLTEYGDVNGKVIHLVQRAPPSSSRASDGSTSRRTESGPRPPGRGHRFLGRDGNTTYLGSLAIPTGFGPDLMEGLEFPTRPSQVMARNRLDCAKRMMGFARQSIRQMEDPTAQPQPSPSGRNQRRTAFRIIPGAGLSSSLEERGSTSTAHQPPEVAIPAAINFVSNILNIPPLRSGGAEEDQPAGPPSALNGATLMAEIIDDHHQDVAVEVEIESSDENAEGRSDVEANIRDNSAEARAAPRPEDGARVDAMVPLLTDLESINTDLQPFLARCRELLSADTSFDDNSSPSYQEAVRVFGGVSETLHNIAHACHALSDLMVDFDEDAPRSLRCRPVVLQHSTILETGFPIRLAPQGFEAQINLRRVDEEANSSSGSESSMTPPTPGPEPSRGNTIPLAGGFAGFATAQPPPIPEPNFPHHPDSANHPVISRFQLNGPDAGDLEIFMDFGLGPEAVRFPFMETAADPGAAPGSRPETAAAGAASGATATGGSAAGTPTHRPASAGNLPPPFPPGITLTNLPGGGYSATGTATATGSLNNLQSTLQAFAGQIRNHLVGVMNHGGEAAAAAAAISAAASVVSAAPGAPTTGAPTTPSSDVTTQMPETTAEGSTGASAAAAAQTTGAATASTGTTTSNPEQAAAGSQTTPTRRTGAGAVPPPIFDMLHSLFQGSFDPALPCNSHHIRAPRRRTPPTQRMRIEMFPPTAATTTGPLRGRNLGRGLVAVAIPATAAQAPQPTAAEMQQRSDPVRVLLEFLSPYSAFINSIARSSGEGEPSPFQSAQDFYTSLMGEPYTEGQSIVIDLLMTLASHLTWTDVCDILVGGGHQLILASVLQQHHQALVTFVRQRLLQGESPSRDTIKKACDRLSAEMRPYIEAIQLTRLRESVDLSATINNYNLAQLPSLIGLVCEPDTPEFGSRLLRCFNLYVRQLVAIIMHCCIDGDQGFDAIVRSCLRLFLRGIPEHLQQWSEYQSVNHFIYYATDLNVPLEDIQSYLVYRIPNETSAATSSPIEAMETDNWTASAAPCVPAPEKQEEGAAEALVAMDTENLPEVLIGTEPWHGTLPAEWVPVIARDSQRQRRQSSQKPFSDAYLTGMPPKRRKLIAATKPQTDSLSQTISDGVRHAIQAAGVSSPMAERAIAEAGRDPALHQAYKEQEKATVGPSLSDDPDFELSRFPNAHQFFNK